MGVFKPNSPLGKLLLSVAKSAKPIPGPVGDDEYSFLRINKFSLLPRISGQTGVDVLNSLLERAFDDDTQ